MNTINMFIPKENKIKIVEYALEGEYLKDILK